MIGTISHPLRETIDLFPDSIVIVNSAGVIVDCNNQTSRFFGYSPDELIGAGMDILIPGHMRGTQRSLIEEFCNNGAYDNEDDVRLWGRHRDGRDLAVDIALSPYRHEGEALVIAVIRNVENLRKIEREIIKKNKHLERINDDLENFACVVSHDLKSPLNSLHDILSLLMLEVSGEKSAEVAELVGEVKRRMHIMQNLVNGILDYSRQGLESGGVEPVNLDRLIHELPRLIQLPAHFSINVPLPLPTVMGNHIKLLQVFLNLASNAVKYNGKPQGVLRISFESTEEEYRFHFADNGKPVPPDQAERIFALFSTNTHPEESDSHGVGLATVKHIVEEYGGRVWYSPSELGGTCINFTIKKKWYPPAAGTEFTRS